ncbi:hypothetical protein CL657_01390 [bacterium]|nr:hypothetical protein [bacterium]|tara:strand:- start:1256 stop:1975 length:720 start_codon:yes stop_codon:yes gene_type:complete
MSSFEELENCFKQNDAMSFLICYLKLLNQNEALELPQSTTKETLITEWEDILPNTCKGGTATFYSSLSSVWLSLLNQIDDNDTTNVIQRLLTVLEQNKQQTNSIDGGIISSTSTDYEIENTIINNPLPKETIIKNIMDALSQNNALAFLEHYCYLCLIDKSVTLPYKTALDTIEKEFFTIITTYFQAKKTLIKEVSQHYFNLIHRYGIPSKQSIRLSFYKHLKNKHTEKNNDLNSNSRY